jgi:hypothetical protein
MGKPRGRRERERTRQGGCPLSFALQRFNALSFYRLNIFRFQDFSFSAFQHNYVVPALSIGRTFS